MPCDDEDPPHVEQFGPGLDEDLYEAALLAEMRRRDISYQSQVWVDVEYKGEQIGKRGIDLIVGDRLIVELKAVEALAPLHGAQPKTYLKIMRLTLGLLINFNVILLEDGVKRVIHHP